VVARTHLNETFIRTLLVFWKLCLSERLGLKLTMFFKTDKCGYLRCVLCGIKFRYQTHVAYRVFTDVSACTYNRKILQICTLHSNLFKPYVEIKCQLDATDDIYCRFYCLLNIFRTPLCPSSGARVYYTYGRCLWYLVLWFSSCRYGVELRVMCPSSPQTGNITLSSTSYRQVENQSTKCHRQRPSV